MIVYNNDKSDLWNIIALLKKVILASFITIVLIIAGFIFCLIKQPKDSTINANGVYNLVDSEGNVVASDLTPDDINKLMDIIKRK